MNENDYRNRIDRERETRGAFGVIAVVFGLLLLAISALSLWGPIEPSADDLHILFELCAVTTIMLSLANLCRPRVLFGAIVQALCAFGTMLAALAFAFASHLHALGPAALSSLLGTLLVAIGGIARINGERGDEVIDETTESGGGGRKWVYRDNRVVAVEEWADGKLVSTSPVNPAIAR